MRVLQIKDLKDLSVFFVGVSIDMQDLKDLKRFFFVGVLAGACPPRYGETEAAARWTRSGSGDPELRSKVRKTLMSIAHADRQVLKVL